MTVPLNNIQGSADSNQMVGGHRGLGMIFNVMDSSRKRNRGKKDYKNEAKLMQYASQLRREELAHKANVTHGEKIEETKAGGFADELAKRMEFGVELDENGRPTSTYRGRREDGPQQGPTSQTGDFNSPEQQQRVQTRQLPLGGTSYSYQTSTGAKGGIGAWQMPQIGGQFNGERPQGSEGPQQGPSGPGTITGNPPPKEITAGPASEEDDIPDAEIIEDEPQAGVRPGTSSPSIFAGKPGSGQRTLIPDLYDLRGPTVQTNADGGFEAIPGRAERAKHNATARKRVEAANAFNAAEAQRVHLERTGKPLPEDVAASMGADQNVLTVPTAQSLQYDKQAAAGAPGFDRTAADEKTRILGAKPVGGVPQRNS